jgi:selenocysteine lyase/cysteine desulfurase
MPSLDVATRLGEQGFFVWEGNYYAINLSEKLGVEASGGMVRIGCAHYNTNDEIGRLLLAIETLEPYMPLTPCFTPYKPHEWG